MEIDVVDRIAARMETGGERQTAIGYDVDFWRFVAAFNIADSRYKVGADFDLLFKYRHGVANLNRCAEGVSPGDEYRVVQTVARDNHPSNRNRIVSTVAGTYRPDGSRRRVRGLPPPLTLSPNSTSRRARVRTTAPRRRGGKASSGCSPTD